MQSKSHWEKIYTDKAFDQVSWYQAHAGRSLHLMQENGVGLDASIIDIGGGASKLVDDLLAEGYTRLTVLDLSGTALAATQARLGPAASSVTWLEADITRVELPKHAYDVWHDRAVFHFLTSEQDRQAYVQTVLRAVKPGGLVIVATFAEDGPLKCSGLPVVRYRPDKLHAEFGEPFTLLGHEREEHHTPGGAIQQFLYCYCRKQDS